MRSETLIRFHLDEHLGHALAAGLRRHGIDVTTTAEMNLISASDPTQLAFAHSQQRVLVTCDDDHLRLDRQGTPHSGIVYCHSKRPSLGYRVKNLIRLWQTTTAEQMVGQVQHL